MLKLRSSKPGGLHENGLSSNSRTNRAGIARLFTYTLLVCGSALFLWPFFWMAATSVKLDRELFRGGMSIWPDRPVPQGKSPYVATDTFDVSNVPRHVELVPVIEGLVRQSKYNAPEGFEREPWIKAIARGVLVRMQSSLPVHTWKLPKEKVEVAAAQFITPELIQELTRQVLRRFSAGALRVRSYDLQEDVLVKPETAAEGWDVQGAELRPVRQNGDAFAEVRYAFNSDDAFRFTQAFTTSFDLRRLHRIQWSYQCDDSWNSVSVTVEMLGKQFRAARPIYLFDSRWAELILQLPGPDDQTNQFRKWILLHKIAEGPQFVSEPHQLKISFEVHRTGQIQAWWAKIKRNYQLTLDHVPFWRYVATSLFLVILNMGATLASCSLVAYAFARLQWPGRGFAFLLMLATMMVPPQVTMIPHFLIIRSLGWYNTLYPLWVPHLFGSAFYIFLLRQFMKGIPRDLEDAARIDGCGFLRIYWHIMIPLVKPTLAVIAIFTFMATWNDFMGPLIYLSDQRLYPLSFGLFALNVQSGNGNFGMMMAGSLLMTLPVIALFFFCQRYFLQGVTLTGMKG